jgi:hypothetical protein
MNEPGDFQNWTTLDEQSSNKCSPKAVSASKALPIPDVLGSTHVSIDLSEWS